MLKDFAPQLFDDRPGGFTVSRQQTNEFMKFYMNWTIIIYTTAASKLPLDWMEQEFNMNYKVAYLAKVYGIQSSIVVN